MFFGNNVEDLFGFIVMLAMGMFLAWMFLWAAEKEEELGISGMSSERILVREEMKK